jgi:hypothetical protein
LKKWDPLLNLQERHKEEGNIVIHPLETRLVKAAGWAHPSLFVDLAGLWLDAADEEKHLLASSWRKGAGRKVQGGSRRKQNEPWAVACELSETLPFFLPNGSYWNQ